MQIKEANEAGPSNKRQLCRKGSALLYLHHESLDKIS